MTEGISGISGGISAVSNQIQATNVRESEIASVPMDDTANQQAASMGKQSIDEIAAKTKVIGMGRYIDVLA